jgi:hypothetical protein
MVNEQSVMKLWTCVRSARDYTLLLAGSVSCILYCALAEHLTSRAVDDRDPTSGHTNARYSHVKQTL